jgi:uncharacterized protein (DUF488 family)
MEERMQALIARAPGRQLWTIGHSSRPIDEFLTFLVSHGIRQLVDVRTIPRSRHNPQFNTDTLARSLKQATVSYVHKPELGGLRKTKKDSINAGWKNASFRGYADYMQTDAFWDALQELMAQSRRRRTAIMCAEAVPWRCHRRLITDALLARGIPVADITGPGAASAARLSEHAVARPDGSVIYPAAPGVQAELFPQA